MVLSTTNLKDTDIMTALGISDHRHSYICSNEHKKLNIWSYRKPTIYNENDSLSDAEFQGQYSEIARGIYCGISMGTNNGRLKELLECTFTYHPPTGGNADPFRVGDFRGYDTAAVPTPTGNIVSPINYGSREQGIVVEFSYNPNNTTGVNLKRFFESGYSNLSGIAENIDNCYLCIIVANPNRTQYAYKALTNWDTKTITPIKHNGGYVAHWFTSLLESDCPALFNGKSNSIYHASLFLVSTLTPQDQYSPKTLSQWTAQAYDSTANTPQGCIGVPLALNIPVTMYNVIEEAGKPENKAVITTGMTANASGFTIAWTKNKDTYSSVYVNI